MLNAIAVIGSASMKSLASCPFADGSKILARKRPPTLYISDMRVAQDSVPPTIAAESVHNILGQPRKVFCNIDFVTDLFCNIHSLFCFNVFVTVIVAYAALSNRISCSAGDRVTAAGFALGLAVFVFVFVFVDFISGRIAQRSSPFLPNTVLFISDEQPLP